MSLKERRESPALQWIQARQHIVRNAEIGHRASQPKRPVTALLRPP
jgi:hypothetical protein